MNFNIDLAKLGELPMLNLIILGVSCVAIVFVWKLPEILEQWRKLKYGDDE